MDRITSEMRDGTLFSGLTLTVGSEASNVITVVLAVDQLSGFPAKIPPFVCYIAEAANGLVVEPPSGGVAAGTRGTVTDLTTADTLFVVQVDDAGFADIKVTQTGTDNLFLIVVRPDTGVIKASGVLAFTA